MEDTDTATVCHLPWLGIQICYHTQNPPVLIRPYRKVHPYHERMNRLLQLKKQYPIDLFKSFVARLRLANAHTCLLSDH